MRILLLPILLVGFYYLYLIDPFFTGTHFNNLEAKRHADSQPIQSVVHNAKTIVLHDHKIVFHHRFSLEALVLSKHNYSADRLSRFSPVDLALGWGPMSNPSPLSLIKISQGNRFYYFRYRASPPIKHTDIISHSANMHLIPANNTIAETLKKIKKGDVISLSGYLVDINGKDGWYWNSSRTRHDTGEGACELVYVEEIKILQR